MKSIAFIPLGAENEALTPKLEVSGPFFWKKWPDIDNTGTPEALRRTQQRYQRNQLFFIGPGSKNEALTLKNEVSGPKHKSIFFVFCR